MEEVGQVSKQGFKLFDQMELQEYTDKLVIKSLNNNNSPPEISTAFSIDRSDGNIQSLIGDFSSGTPTKVFIIYGVVGTIRLLAGTYLLVITSRKEVGTYLGFPIFRVMSMKFMACNGILRLSSCQESDGVRLLMSTSLQRTGKLAEGRARKPLWKQADPRFVWNRSLLEELIECKLDAFIIPLVQGSILKSITGYDSNGAIATRERVVSLNRVLGFQTVQINLKDTPAKITLISRRCTRRLGTRMWRRGANLEGDTANFIETEQLLEIEGFRYSFLQVRGSIPLLWEQIVDLSYKPRIKIVNHEETPKIVQRHFNDLIQRYGEAMAVDLTEKHGDEGQLSMAFATEMQKVPQIRYVSFDFHHFSSKSNFDHLQPLFDQISGDFEKQGYFLIDSGGQILMEQKGVVRANCIDCLDRTNVTQSYLAQKSLNSQLQRIGALSSTECISLFSDIYEKFRTIWAEQGDEISLEYAGTSALKGDLVRFGRQTVPGLIKDGVSALSRYYLNNFHDGIRQARFPLFHKIDAMDLISGRYTVNRNSPSPFQLNGFESFSYLPVASAFVVGGITLTSITFNQVGRNAQHFVSAIIWAGLTAGAMAVVKANGRQFCSRPRLCDLR
ncbi:hypothetical protein IFM89_011271 [Coptis chinensis]|uniref:SAC domain-containing protein n=1 Tax=Coptis chinensis TaxID=261450 RepID=A0A835HDN4_9MAGN|nr:hypothetical protein IFM89_011271 [Coptis chinensis]